MGNFDGTLCRLLLNVVSSTIIVAVLVKIASVYRYVQVFV